tara:strand:- start:3179 stop:4357 length:1179 start_codon:yes stop_codon:yes gene_type:complete
MADVTSFMAEGKAIPAGSALTDITKQTVLPDWYSQNAMDILANQKAIAARPFQEYVDASGKPIPRVADFAPDQQAGFGATRSGAFSFRPELGTASSKTQDVFGRSAMGVSEPGFKQSGEYTASSTAPTGLNMAQPYLGQAGQTAVQNIGQYMNPYMDQVIGRIGTLGARTLQEQLLPAISDQMIAAGQFGGTRQAEMTGRAIRDTMEGISAQQAQALQQGYTSAAGLAQADLERQAQLAQTAGGLGFQQQGALARAGEQMGALGQQMGNMYNVDTSNQLGAAQQLAGMARQRQTQELEGAGALGQIGAQQQALAQRNLDIARSDFLERQAYPQQQIDALTKTMQGVSGGVPTATQEYGIQPTGYRPEYPASTAAQIGSVATGAASVIKALKD